MSSSRAKKLVIVGLDAFTPTIVERLVAAGSLPTLARFMQRGCYARATPFWTCDTGGNWASIASGASPIDWSSNRQLPGQTLL